MLFMNKYHVKYGFLGLIIACMSSIENKETCFGQNQNKIVSIHYISM